MTLYLYYVFGCEWKRKRAALYLPTARDRGAGFLFTPVSKEKKLNTPNTRVYRTIKTKTRETIYRAIEISRIHGRITIHNNIIYA